MTDRAYPAETDGLVRQTAAGVNFSMFTFVQGNIPVASLLSVAEE